MKWAKSMGEMEFCMPFHDWSISTSPGIGKNPWMGSAKNPGQVFRRLWEGAARKPKDGKRDFQPRSGWVWTSE